MKKSTKIKLIRAVTSSKDYTDKDKLRLIKNLLDETLPSSTLKTEQLSTDPQNQTGGSINIETKEANQFLTSTNKTDLLLAKLPTDITTKVQSYYDKREYDTLLELIECGFIWDETPEGSEYWAKLVKIIYHFQTLPQPYQDQAIKNIDMEYAGGSSVVTLKQSVFNGFSWCGTEQEITYWEKFYETL